MFRNSHKLITMLATVAVASLAFAGVAGAQGYTPPAGVADTTNPSPGPGDSFTVSGTTTPNSVVRITLSDDGGASATTPAGPVILGETVSDATGAYSLTVSIPADRAGTGTNSLVVTSNGVVISSSVLAFQDSGTGTGAGTATGTGSGTLAVTGSNTLTMVVTAGLLVLAGAGFVLMGRRHPAVARAS